MEIAPPPKMKASSRIGFHYFPDDHHFRESDLEIWIPELNRLGAAYLILQSPLQHAIPENFLTSLIQAGIQPVLHYSPSLEEKSDFHDTRILLEIYGKWGIKNIILYDRPNNHASWNQSSWSQPGLVERFLDRFIPLASLAVDNGISPVLPPLEPGGNYWDTAFLRDLLNGLVTRRQENLLKNLAVSAYGWFAGKKLNWGAGGPERWPESRPYFTPQGEEDQCGFRIFDWYQTIVQSIMHTDPPFFLLGLGCDKSPVPSGKKLNSDFHNRLCTSIYKNLNNLETEDPCKSGELLEPVSAGVVCGSFWLLSTEPGSPYEEYAWFKADGSWLPVVKSIKEINKQSSGSNETMVNSNRVNNTKYPLSHYVLLPSFEWGVADFHLEVIKPFIKKYKPAVGFSLDEARLASRITVIGGENQFSEQIINQLRLSGSIVEHITGDGSSIASQLAER